MSDEQKSGSGGYGGYGYGNNNYYYGYGYNYGGGGGYGGEDQPQRGFKDYLLILRERIWYFVVTFFIIFTGTILFTFNATPVYRSYSTVQVFRDEVDPLQMGDIQYDNISNAEDFNTQVRVLESISIVNAVAERIKDEDRKRLMAPYEDALRLRGPLTIQQILARDRTVAPVRLSLIIQIMYDHPDPNMAAFIANLFADEYISYNSRLDMETAMRAVDDLETRVELQRKKVEEIESGLVEYSDRHNNISLDEGDNILRTQVAQQDRIVTDARHRFDMVETQWNLVQEYKAENSPLENLPFIAGMRQISELVARRSAQNIDIATLSKRYLPKFPRMEQALQNMDQIEEELDAALVSAVEQIRVEYLQAKKNYEVAAKTLAQKKQEVIGLNKLAVEYNSRKRDLEVNQSLYQKMVLQRNSQMAKVQLDGANARIIDDAAPSPDPYKPNIGLNLAVGFFGGGAAGLALVFAIAFMDDRIKSAFDIESAVGLPLIGVVPRIKRLNSPEKAKAVAGNADRRVTEAFRAIHSALKINETSKNAKIIVTTSTSPSEGKSFVSTNLALTFAIHGERTLVIDADLRMPNVGKSLSIQEKKGVVPYFGKELSLDEAIIKDFYPNLDVMPAGGKAKNPTQIINSPNFESMLAELSEKYDRIFIDTPPIAAVSDVLTILPLADGVIYVIKYNSVKRKTAKANLRRIIESNTPVFGAILNQISVAVASYYYTNYYDKSYQDYYHHDEDDDVVAVEDKAKADSVKS